MLPTPFYGKMKEFNSMPSPKPKSKKPKATPQAGFSPTPKIQNQKATLPPLFLKFASTSETFLRKLNRDITFRGRRHTVSFNLLSLVQGSAFFVVVIAVSIFASNLFFRPAAVDSALAIKNVTITQTSKAIAGQPISYALTVKRSDISKSHYLIQLPKGVRRISVSTITSAEQKTLVSAPVSNFLNQTDRQRLAATMRRNQGIFARVFDSLRASIDDTVTQVTDIISSATTAQQVTQTSDASFVDLSSQAQTNADLTQTNADTSETEIAASPTSVGTRNDDGGDTGGGAAAASPSASPVASPVDASPTDTPTPSTTETPASSLVPSESPSESASQTPTPTSTPKPKDDYVQVDYQLPAPAISAQDTSSGQQVTVSAPATAEPDPQVAGHIAYTNVLAFTTIPEIFKVGEESKIKIKWKNQGNQPVSFHAYDLNQNGKLDYVEWTVPHLSAQTFDIIFISKAFQLDTDQTILADIYDTVKDRDQNYAAIDQNQYVRVTFNSPLASNNDITLYAKPSDPSKPVKIEVYPLDQNGNEQSQLTGVSDGASPMFDHIDHNGKYRILLSNLQNPTDMFDLKVVNASVSIDYIVDPGVTFLKTFLDEGKNPYDSLVLSGSTFYGTTSQGGVSNKGTVYSINTDGTGYALLHEFAGSTGDGSAPIDSPLLSGGVLYGVTPTDGSSSDGIIYSINTDGTGYTILHNFTGTTSDGRTPFGSFAISGSTLYGMTHFGGANDDGAIYSIDTSGSGFTLLHSFTFAENSSSYVNAFDTTLVLSSSTLYGLTSQGGSHNGGTIFSIGTDGNGYTVLYNFDLAGIPVAPSNPTGTLLLSSSTLYGVTEIGGANNQGIIYSIGTDGNGFTNLHDFNEGGLQSDFNNSLILSGSTLYGQNTYAGASSKGILYSIDTSGSGFAVLHTFTGSLTDGHLPSGKFAIIGSVLYGVTNLGGTLDAGVLYSINTSGTGFSVLYNFLDYPDGGQPQGSLIQSGGKLYGMANVGGNYGLGTVYSMNTDGTGFLVLHHFGNGSDGYTPYGSLAISGSTLYGMTQNGGTDGEGTIFSISTSGSGYTVLHNFLGDGVDGINPYGSLLVSASTLYGMTSAGGSGSLGTIFSVSTGGTGFTILHNFAGGSGDGASPFGSLILSGSTLYGMTRSGGSSNIGTAFSISTGGSGFGLLHTFTGGSSNGSQPYGTLALSGSTLYGVTRLGGSSSFGTVFSMSTSGSGFSVIHSFTGGAGDGKRPSLYDSALALSGFTFYGLTAEGGAHSTGTIFSFCTDASGYGLQYSFSGYPSNGDTPFDGLVLASSTFYGTTTYGGEAGIGDIFSFVPSSSSCSGGNTAPSITVAPSDGGSSATTPTNAGSNVVFTATATDTESDSWYLALCTTSAVTAHNGAAPTCDVDKWCISGSTASGSGATCNYATSASDAETNAWYAFACDNNASAACSAVAQGSGDTGSPFVVNHAPSFSAISNTSGYLKAGDTVTFTSTASDADTSSTVTLYVCKANDFTGTACGAGNEWCHSSATATNPSCNYTVLVGDGDGSHNYYANIIDNFNFASTSNSRPGTFTTDVTPPVVDAGIDQTQNSQFTQDATASDATSGIATYQWSKISGPGAITFGTATSQDSTVSADTVGTYVIRLTVTDQAGNSNFDEFTLTWQNVPTPTPTPAPASGGNPAAVIPNPQVQSQPPSGPQSPPQFHGACNLQSQCVSVSGAGQDQCQVGNYADTSMYCAILRQVCATLNCPAIGINLDTCLANAACANQSPAPSPVSSAASSPVNSPATEPIVSTGPTGPITTTNPESNPPTSGSNPIVSVVPTPPSPLTFITPIIANIPLIIKSFTTSLILDIIKLPDFIKFPILATVTALREAVLVPAGLFVVQAITAAGLVAMIINIIADLFASPLTFPETFLIPLRLWTLILYSLGIKKRERPWGVVYDSVTKQPVDPAYVVLKDLEGNTVVSAITDIDGRFGFLAEPGKYTMAATKSNYLFPSKKMQGKTKDDVYENLYYGEEFEVKARGEAIIKNIPVDAFRFDWNEFIKKEKNLTGFYSRWDSMTRKLTEVLFVLGFALAAVAYAVAPFPYNTIVLVFYLVVLVLRLLGIKPTPFGHVMEKVSGKPLSFAVIKIMLPGINREISHKVTDRYGRYYCLVPKGKYILKIEKKQDDQSYAPVYVSEVIDASKNGIIKKTFEV